MLVVLPGTRPVRHRWRIAHMRPTLTLYSESRVATWQPLLFAHARKPGCHVATLPFCPRVTCGCHVATLSFGTSPNGSAVPLPMIFAARNSSAQGGRL